MANTWLYFLSDKSSTLTAKVQPTVFLGSLLHKHSELFILYIFLRCVILFQITKPGNVESIEEKKFIGIFDHKSIFLHKNFQVYSTCQKYSYVIRNNLKGPILFMRSMPTGHRRQHFKLYIHHYKYLYLPHVGTHDPQPQAGGNLDNRSTSFHLQPQQYDRHQVNGSPAQTDLQTREEIGQKLTIVSPKY